MTTKLDIVNLSMLMMGARKISSLTDDTKTAELANSVYDHCAMACFEIPIEWYFAIARNELVQITDAPAFGTYLYQYAKPSGYVRPLAMIDENDDEFEYESKEEVYISPVDGTKTDVILSNEDYVYLKYIIYRDEPNIYPAWFCNLIAAKIAFFLAAPLRGGADNYTSYQIEKLWAMAFDEARIGNASHNIKIENNENVERGGHHVLDAMDTSLI